MQEEMVIKRRDRWIEKENGGSSSSNIVDPDQVILNRSGYRNRNDTTPIVMIIRI